MKITLCLALMLSAALANNIKLDPNSDEFINHINSQQNDWKAGRNYGQDIPISEFKKRLGALKSISKSNIVPTVHSKDIEIPESFDARTNWPECTEIISDIVDQSNCGSSWALTTASVISDRRCIATGGVLQVPVSAEDLLSCCDTCIPVGPVCKGGYPRKAFEYWFQKGIVTGGKYNSSLGCIPYLREPCSWTIVPSYYVKCDDIPDIEPKCTRSCSTSGLNYNSEVTYGKSTVETFETIEDVQREILQNGPVSASFIVYEDFIRYKSGVYYYVWGEEMGGHAGRIIGWGTENNTDYWLIANSWNEYWGDNGLFKIKRGVNECDIEKEIFAAQAKV